MAVDPALLGRDRVLTTWAGLRVLPGGGGSTVDARRETAFLVGRGGMLTVAGGKLTTYRRIALGALERLAPELGLRGPSGRAVPLPGAADARPVASRLASRHGLDLSTATHLATLYGSEAHRVASLGSERPDLLEPIAPGGPDIRAQVVHAAREEWAVSADDVLTRRTTVAYRGLASPRTCQTVEELLRESARA